MFIHLIRGRLLKNRKVLITALFKSLLENAIIKLIVKVRWDNREVPKWLKNVKLYNSGFACNALESYTIILNIL